MKLVHNDHFGYQAILPLDTLSLSHSKYRPIESVFDASRHEFLYGNHQRFLTCSELFPLVGFRREDYQSEEVTRLHSEGDAVLDISSLSRRGVFSVAT